MLVLPLLLSLQAAQPDERPNTASVEFTAIRGFWLPDFRGSFRADGGTQTGTPLRIVEDLHLPDEAAIPIYGGGDISVTVAQSFSEKDKLRFSAEYWTHGWAGYSVLTSP